MLLKNVSLGTYYPGTSILHRLQARTKLVVVLIFVVGLVIAGRSYWDFTPYFVAMFLTACGIACSGISMREIWRRLWLLSVLVLLGVLIGLFTPVGVTYAGRQLAVLPPLLLTPPLLLGVALVVGAFVACYLLLKWLPLPVLRRPRFRQGLKQARRVALWLVFIIVPLALYAYFSQPTQFPPRLAYMITSDNVWYSFLFLTLFLTLYSCSLLLTMTTSPMALIEGLTMLMTPLRWLRLPVDDFALMSLVALRFVPTLLEEIEQLVKAQAARGSSFSSGSLGERIRSVLALFTPFLRNTLRRASELAIALDARGYQVEGQQTRLYEKKLARVDYVVLLVVGGLLLVALII